MKKEHYIFGGLVAVFVFLFALETLTFYRQGEEVGGMAAMHREMMGGVYGGMIGFGWSFWVLLALLALFLYFLLKEGSGREDPLEILKARYARGELTREEYLQAVKDLMER